MDEALKHSVTKDDYTDQAGRKNQAIQFIVSPYQSDRSGLPPMPPAYWSPGRDDVLRSTMFYEAGWASTVYIATSKLASLSWVMKGLGMKARRARDLFIDADNGDGYVSFLSRHLRDYLTTDNGAFIEIVRATSSSGSRVIGLFHLDSRRCIRTGDPDVPVLYRDRKNRLHELKDHEVAFISDMPEPGDMWFGVGYCAASRAYPAIYRQWALERYVTEKVTGRKPTAIHLVNNINERGIESAIMTAEEQQASKGFYAYMGAIIVPNIDPTSNPGVATIQLVGLPEGFDPDKERRHTNLLYANAIGLDPQDVDPQLLASHALGTGAQSRVISDKAGGKGLVAWRQGFAHLVNEKIVPDDVSFFFKERDYRDQLLELEVQKDRTKVNVDRIKAGIITPEQAVQLLVDADDLPHGFVTTDETPVEEIGDLDNPMPTSDETLQQKFDEYGFPEHANAVAEQQAKLKNPDAQDARNERRRKEPTAKKQIARAKVKEGRVMSEAETRAYLEGMLAAHGIEDE